MIALLYAKASALPTRELRGVLAALARCPIPDGSLAAKLRASAVRELLKQRAEP